MKLKNIIISAVSLSLIAATSLSSVVAAERKRPDKSNTYKVNSSATVTNKGSDDSSMNMYKNSDFIEKEQPELNDETKQLISAYQKNPTLENYVTLREMVIVNYNAVLDKKEAKLAELKQETEGKPGGEDKVAEMNEIVQEMYVNYWSRINSSMLRFTDTRLLKWKIADAPKYEYIPVMGAGETIYVKRTQVTNAEYAQYIAATGAAAPTNWGDGSYPAGEDDYPVNYVSYDDAEAYCEWLTQKDGNNIYRLPTESEWELAAGHMPKDADFNCGVNDGRTSVNQYEKNTRGAHGAIDFWGNVWEWTSTDKSGTGYMEVKGGSWKSDRTDCRTEYRKETRYETDKYDDVGFRVIQVLGGEEPEEKVELATLEVPTVSAYSADDSVTLSWEAIAGVVEYQVFGYSYDTGLFTMLDRTDATSVTYSGLTVGDTYGYVVQPVSYTAISDNVYPEDVIRVVCGKTTLAVSELENTDKYEYDVQTITYHSDYLNKDRIANVYLPFEYDENKRYNVIYLLHGMGGDYNSYSNMGMIELAQDVRIDNNLDSVIMVSMNVFCDQDGKEESDYSFASIAQRYDNCVYDIIDSLMPYINSHYPTYTGREHTAICGYSFGAREAMYLTYSHPECFGYVGAFSPVSGVVDTGSNNFTKDGKALMSTLELGTDYKQPEVIVMVVGTEDTHCLKSAGEYDEYMTERGIEHIFYTMNGGHDENVWKDGFATFVEQIFR